MASSKHFQQNFSFKVNDNIEVSSYKSKTTGLGVVVAQVPGPIVNGYLCVATEALDDDGLPHTLEHLIFMGSEDYQFKGVLDLLANRCLASGTNAWTDTDNTTYTMTTAGSEGFLNLLPIYLDHVLYPTLISSAYITEVHHINGEGEDAGVVYCEMQARENTGESRTHLELLRAMYPGKCGYKSETGGILRNLRESTSHKKVVDYHKAYYRPDNLCVIIVGQVTPEAVFKSLKTFEKKVEGKGKLPPFKRPWTSPVPPLPNNIVKTIQYGADEEESGMVVVGWRGPKALQLYEMTAMDILLIYLTDTAVSPLQREFVEKHPPLANDVSSSVIENSEGVVYFHFSNVPSGRLGEVTPRLIEVLKGVSEGTDFDLVRMRNEVHRKINKTLNAFEDDPHEHIAGMIIGHFLYGRDPAELQTRLNDVEMMRKLEKEPSSFWRGLIDNFFLNKDYVAILGKPSKKMMEKMGAEEKARVKKQREKLGESGLICKKDELDEAIERNEVEPPTEMLESVPIPGVASIQFHAIQQRRNFGALCLKNAKQNGDAPSTLDVNAVPVPIQVDDVKSNFVEMSVAVDTKEMDPSLKFYLPLYLSLLFETNMSRDSGKTVIPHTSVIADLSRDTVHYGASLGVGGGSYSFGEYADLLCITIKVEESKFAVGVQWLKDLLYHVHFTEERVKTVATKNNNEIPSLKRSGKSVLRALNRNLNFGQKSPHWFASFMRQHRFLTDVLQRIDSGCGDDVLLALNDVKRFLICESPLILHVAADTRRLAEALSPEDLPLTKHFMDWPQPGSDAALVRDGDGRFQLPVADPTSVHVKPYFEKSVGFSMAKLTHAIMGIGSVESAFLTSTTRCLDTHDHVDLPPLLVLIQYLTQLEGPMWRQIRGQGLSYHCSISADVEQGLLYFVLHKSTHLVSAFKEGKKIVEQLLNGEEEVDPTEFEAAKSSLVFEVIEEEKTVADAALISILSYFRGIPHTYNKQLLNLISHVTPEDIIRVGNAYMLPLFDPAKSRTAVVCHPTKVEEMLNEFQELEVPLLAVSELEHEFLASTELVTCTCN